MTNLNQNIHIPATLGPSFLYELQQAGLANIPFSYDAKGMLLAPDTSSETIAQIQNIIAQHNPLEEDPFTYQKLRAQAYPHAGDQLDELMKWIASSSDPSIPTNLKNVAQSCMDVKAQYPKPSTSV